ncbi:MAG: response regulator [Gammaproteobacteria bacterium]|nr:response regulator [Gammaproteobacteria bacterium]MCP5424870.1 response regulator [Gammaproteobacteria bacterium]MCP5458153.1 response regulator [Gammaproteobacteria bacterium]
MRKKILVIDDDPELRKLLSGYLNRNGYDVLLLPDAVQVDAYIERYAPHMLVLDLMLPGEDGLAVCRRLRGQGEDIPILMLTARDEAVDRIIGLEMGADDYLGKPFDPRELTARIEAVLRRHPARNAGLPDAASDIYSFGDCQFDRAARQLRRGDQVISLSSREYALLNVFVRYAHKPLSRERLLELTRGEETETFDRAIDVQVFRLRRLLEPDPTQPRYLQTVWGVGYVFVPDGMPR